MAENASETSKQTTKPKPKYVEGTVVIQTPTFDPLQPVLINQAAAAFAAQRGDDKLTNVAVTLSVHKVGESVTYNVTGEIAG